MTTKKIGKVSWEEADVQQKSSDFAQMKDEGDYDFRIFTSPYQFYSHWTKDATGKDKKVHCAVDDCPVCERGEKASARWFIGVINRKTNKCEILEIGSQVYQQLLVLAKNPKWGDPKGYDITITRKPKGSNPLYAVVPNPKTAFSDEEKTMAKEFTGRVDLVKLSASPSADKVREVLGLVAISSSSTVSSDFDTDDDSSKTTEEDDFGF